jgi:hypothetical protein
MALVIANVNEDAYGDIVISAARADGQSNSVVDAGEVYVLYGKASGWTSSVSAASIGSTNAGFVMFGQATNDLFGYSLAKGRPLGSNKDSLIIGVPAGSEAGSGKVQVFMLVSLPLHAHWWV